MPTYAILGATGSTGGSILNFLTETAKPGLSIRLYVRSSQKLYQHRPNLQQHPDIAIFEGPLTSSSALANCILGADVIFSTVAANTNTPGQSLAFDTAATIVASLESLKAKLGPAYQPPTVVVLSAGLVNPVFTKEIPAIPRALLMTALSNNISDHQRAEAFYREQQGTGLLDVIFAYPPGLLPGEKRTGYVLSTEKTGSAVMYGDLGAGMVEMAERKAEFAWKGVGVIATGKLDVNWGPNIRNLLVGLLAHFAPRLYCWLTGEKRSKE